MLLDKPITLTFSSWETRWIEDQAVGLILLECWLYSRKKLSASGTDFHFHRWWSALVQVWAGSVRAARPIGSVLSAEQEFESACCFFIRNILREWLSLLFPDLVFQS